MLVPNLLPKVVPHGSRLLPRFIVRIRGRLVASKPPLDPAPTRSPRPSRRLGGPHPGHPRPVAALSQREGLLALRLLAPASLLPDTVLPEPAQPQGTGPGARTARVAEGIGRGSLRPFGRLRRAGHDPHPGDREGEGISQGPLLRAGYLRQERFQDRVDLRLQGGPRSRSLWGGYRLRSGRGVLRREAHRGKPSWLGIVTRPTWRTKGLRGCSGSVAG